ncbi:MAG: DUF2635 domain-containing protein [Piscinibacter sp.]|nr:DUF2635 domain-containing protein [Piscinibacter sp.]
MHVKPADGLTVLDPETRQPLPAEGATVANTTYWARRLRDQDVVLLPPVLKAVARKTTGAA